MALDLNNLLMPVQQLNPLKGLFGNDLGMEQQRLDLARQEFEETKKRNEEASKFHQMEVGAQLARSQLEAQRADAKAKAEVEAETLKQKREANLKFAELLGQGKVEEAQALVPAMTSLGMQVDLQGEAHGLPRYSVYMSPEEAAADQRAQAAQGIGYPSNEQNPSANEPGIGSTAEAFGRAQAAMPGLAAADSGREQPRDPETGEPALQGDLAVDSNQPSLDVGGTNFQPARGPSEPDYMGSVPKHVIDTGAMAAQTLAKLHPFLGSQVATIPEGPYRDAMAQTAAGIESTGLPLLESLKQFDTARKPIDERMRADTMAAAQSSSKEAAQADKDYTTGFTQSKDVGEGVFNLKDLWQRRSQIANAREILTNKDPNDDYLAGAAIARLTGERTTQSDIERALGTGAASFFQKIANGLYKEAFGGLSDTQKTALKGVLDQAEYTDKKKAFDFLHNTDEQLRDPGISEAMRKGIDSFRRMSIPRDWRDEFELSKKNAAINQQVKDSLTNKPFNMEEDAAAQDIPSPLRGNDFDNALRTQASAAGLNPDAIKYVMRAESGKAGAGAESSQGARGIVQIMPDNLRAMGTDPEEYAQRDATGQLPEVMKYFVRTGKLNPKSTNDDYYVATAAPKFVGKPDSTIVYPMNSKEWWANAPWRGPDGEITVGSIKAYARRQNGIPDDAAPPAASLAMAPTAAATEAAQSSGAVDVAKARAVLERFKQ